MDTATETLTAIETLNNEISVLETECRDAKLALDVQYGDMIKAKKAEIASLVKAAQDDAARAQKRLLEIAKLGKSHVPGTIAHAPRRANRPFTEQDCTDVLRALRDGARRFDDVCSLVPHIPADHVRKALGKLREDGRATDAGATANKVYFPADMSA